MPAPYDHQQDHRDFGPFPAERLMNPIRGIAALAGMPPRANDNDLVCDPRIAAALHNLSNLVRSGMDSGALKMRHPHEEMTILGALQVAQHELERHGLTFREECHAN